MQHTWVNSFGETVEETPTGLRVLNAAGESVLRPARGGARRGATVAQARANEEVIELPFIEPRPYWKSAAGRDSAPARGTNSLFIEPRPYFEQAQK
jgi:hypothetical protein